MCALAAEVLATQDETGEGPTSDVALCDEIAVQLAEEENNKGDSESEICFSHVGQLSDIDRSASSVTATARVAVLHAITSDIRDTSVQWPFHGRHAEHGSGERQLRK